MAGPRTQAALWAIAGACLIFALGAYAQSVSGGERGSFTMNFPATGKECGGPSPRELTGYVSVSVDDMGLIKRAVQPNVFEIASHVVRNVGDKPYEISFEASGFPESTEWHSRDKAWNPETRSIDRPIAPGEAVDVGLRVTLAKPLPDDLVLLNGSITIRDRSSGEKLSELPVTILREGATGVMGGACCE